MARIGLAIAFLLPVTLSCATDVPVKPLRSVQVYGTVRNPHGQGVPGVFITFVSPSFAYYQTETDAVGAFQTRAAEGTYVATLRVEDFATVVQRSIRLSAPTTRFDYTFGGYRVAGTITGPTGAPVDSGEIWANGQDSLGGYVDTRRAFSDGRYEAYLPSGQYRFGIVPRDPGVPWRFMDLAVRADTTLDLSIVGDRISGAVTAGPGMPLSGATVRASGGNAFVQAKTDPAGSYTLYLPAGDYDWYIDPAGPESIVYPLAQSGPGVSGPSTLDFDLSGVDWTGVVRIAPSGIPVAGAKVYVDRGWVSTPVVCTSDGSGAFHLILRPSRRYNLQAEAAGAGTFTSSGVLAGNDSTFDILLPPAFP